jgi:hypothetical protein
MQIINKRYNSASESATAFQSLAIALQSRAGRLEKAGVKVFDVGADGTKRLKDFYSIVDAIGRSSLMKDPGKLIRTLGRAEAVFPLQQLIRLREERDAIREAGEDTGAVDRDLKEYNESRVGKFNRYYNSAKEGAQGLVADTIEGNIQGFTALGALFDGSWFAVDRKAESLKADEAALRESGLAVQMRYAAKGLVIDPQQAMGVAAIEDDQRWRGALAQLGLGPAVTDEERANLRQYATVNTGDGGTASVDAQGNLATISAAGMAILFERAMTNALKASGLSGPLKVGADAVAGAAKSAPSIRRRP